MNFGSQHFMHDEIGTRAASSPAAQNIAPCGSWAAEFGGAGGALALDDLQPGQTAAVHGAAGASWDMLAVFLASGRLAIRAEGAAAAAEGLACTIVRFPAPVTTVVVESADRTAASGIVVGFSLRDLLGTLGVEADDLRGLEPPRPRDEAPAMTVMRFSLRPDMPAAVAGALQYAGSARLRDNYLAATARFLCTSFFVGLLAASAQRDLRPRLSSRDRGILESAHVWLSKDHSCSLSLAAIARRLGTNRTKLSLGFKNAFGVGVAEFQRQARLQRAAELIRTTDLSMSCVAQEVGYEHASSFTFAFKRQYRISPKEMRSLRNIKASSFAKDGPWQSGITPLQVSGVSR